MLRRRLRLTRLRTMLAGVILILLLLVLAKIHACACTGGQPHWRPAMPTSP